MINTHYGTHVFALLETPPKNIHFFSTDKRMTWISWMTWG